MSRAVACCGCIVSLLSVAMAVLGFFAAITSQWVVLELGGNHPNGSSANVTVQFGMTHICVDSECSKHDYVPPVGCQRTAGDFNERVGAIEGFIIIGFMFATFISLLTPIATLKAMQNDWLRERMRHDVEYATEGRVLQLQAAESVLKKRILGLLAMAVLAIFSCALSVGLFSAANSSYLYCTSICNYFLSLYPYGSCGFGASYYAALAALIVGCCMTLAVAALVAVYVSKYDTLFDGIHIAEKEKSSDPFSDHPRNVHGGTEEKGTPASPVRKAWGESEEGETDRGSPEPQAVPPRNQSQEGNADEVNGSKPAPPRTTPQRRKDTPPRRTPQRQISPANADQKGTTESPKPKKSSPQNNKKVNPLDFTKPASDSTHGYTVLAVHKEIIANLQGDDWDYVEESQLYWSASQGLYFDPTSMNFYDPDTDQWYDPDSEEWYTLEEDETDVVPFQ